MKLEHVAIYVQDLEKAKAFFMKYFNAQPNEKYHNPRTNLMTYFLTFSGGARLEIMTRPEIIELDKNIFRTGLIHLSMQVGGEEKVRELTERLRTDGYQVISEPRKTGDGYYESCVLDGEGNQIEIVA
ncbi:VOC family protein [[Mannheimia] succiniciproducens]|uniref:GloA protein n=1 Tax=Mannheimia succiniciproducens (strain KCTC 0769BP / MBEL55E) TaxID=221988 RepID=Q65V06_MANSM|nr:VOC family protein [[Mannheimia] succiniciproducens]AAU37204.1 GloA protein [[Mannheimia] succiniciproducens MBEL55E]